MKFGRDGRVNSCEFAVAGYTIGMLLEPVQSHAEVDAEGPRWKQLVVCVRFAGI
jgi:hypothetical protein